jgi:hypothetical protein
MKYYKGCKISTWYGGHLTERKEEKNMEFSVDQVPAEARWAMATKGLTGALTAYQNVMLNMAGREKYDEIMGQIWGQIGKMSAEMTKASGMEGGNAQSAALAFASSVMIAMGPEYQIEVVEASEDRTVMKVTECPFWNRIGEFGIAEDLLTAGDNAFCKNFVETLNPNISMKHGSRMHLGATHCEWIFEKKK